MRHWLRILGVLVCLAGIAWPASAGTDVTLFRLYMLDGSVLTSYGEFAERRKVTFGRGSLGAIEVTSGLEQSELFILSDTTKWDNWNRLRLD